MTCTSNRGRHFSSHDFGSLSVARHNSRDKAARRAVSRWRMPSLEVGIVNGGKEYLGEGMVGGHDESNMLARENESRLHREVKTEERSMGRGGVTFVSHA